jgi:parallel beta-helix repeat protein
MMRPPLARSLFGTLLTFALAAAAMADSPTVLKFTQNGTNLTVLATLEDDSEVFWQVVIDETRGVITKFYDFDSPAGPSFNYACPYAFGPGIFAPWDTGIRDAGGGWVYAAGTKVNGQTSYTYTLTRTTADVTRVSTVTLNVPTPTGTWFNAITTSTYHTTAALAQTCTPTMYLNAATEAEMNAIYAGSKQDSLVVDGTLWSQITVQGSAEAGALGLTAGRTFRLTALNLTNGTGTMNLDNATVMSWHNSFRCQNSVTGGIYNNAQSKPPAGTVVHTYVRMDMNILGTGVIVNETPVAAAGSDRSIVDMNDNGSETVTLDGSSSSDGDGPLMSYLWKEGGTTIATGSTATVTLPVGEHVITLTVTDSQGATAEDSVTISIIERTPMTFYVDQKNPAASDANPGTEALPYATINKATTVALPGDTIIVKRGLYRERVSFASSGTADKPITLRSKPGDHVIISGSVELAGWAPLAEADARGNTNFGHIYYVDLTWKPTRLDENGVKLEQAKSPNTGWWVVEAGSDATHIVDAAHLTQSDPNYWVGAELYYRDMQPVIEHRANVTAYDPATHTVTIDGNLTWTDAGGVPYPPVPGIDRYQMFNKLEFLDRAGEWVAEDRGGGTYRVYVWPTESGNAADELFEVTTQTNSLIAVSSRSYIAIDGFEVRHTTGYAQAVSVSGSDHITIRNCVANYNDYMGFSISDSDFVTLSNSISTLNGYGVAIGGSSDITVEECEISRGSVDGLVISYDSHRVYVRRNYIHDHVLYGHPDNLQFHHGVYDIWYEDNAIINSGQSCMMEAGYGIHFINNIIAASGGYMLHTGNPSTDIELRNNTMALSGYGLFGVRDTIIGLDFQNNIFYHGHSKLVWGVAPVNEYTGDYNLFFQGPGLNANDVVGWNGTWMSVANFATGSGQDAHSFYADPQLANVPAYWIQLESDDIPLFTTNTVSVAEYDNLFAVGDHIEFDFDGVLRTITAKNGRWLTFEPALDEPMLLGGCVANWKTKTNNVLDFTPVAGSPALGSGPKGTNIGSSVNLTQYRQGDFDGDGVRDIPVWPAVETPEIPTLEIAATSNYDWVYPNTPTTTADRHACTVTVEITAGAVDGEVYTVALGEGGGALANFQAAQGTVILPGAAMPLSILGGQRTTSSPGQHTINVTVTGATYGQTATQNVSIRLRLLGDVDGDGLVNASDKLEMNKKLNGLATLPGITLRDLDLSGDGALVNAEDKLAINQVLNGLVVP